MVRLKDSAFPSYSLILPLVKIFFIFSIFCRISIFNGEKNLNIITNSFKKTTSTIAEINKVVECRKLAVAAEAKKHKLEMLKRTHMEGVAGRGYTDTI